MPRVIVGAVVIAAIAASPSLLRAEPRTALTHGLASERVGEACPPASARDADRDAARVTEAARATRAVTRPTGAVPRATPVPPDRRRAASRGGVMVARSAMMCTIGDDDGDGAAGLIVGRWSRSAPRSDGPTPRFSVGVATPLRREPEPGRYDPALREALSLTITFGGRR